MFDRLHTGSFLGGFNASISGNMPAMSHYITTGIEPFVAVYTAVEVSIFTFATSIKKTCSASNFVVFLEFELVLV